MGGLLRAILEWVNPVTDLGVASGSFHLQSQIEAGTLTTPVALAGGSLLFVWRGRADAVHLSTWMPAFPPVPPFTRLGGSDLWVLELPLPDAAMIEYRLSVVRGSSNVEILDPFNPRTTTNPFGTNSVATGPSYREPAWANRHGETRAGRLVEGWVASKTWGERRRHSLYLPVDHEPATAVPLVLVHDGTDFWRHSSLGVVLDNLIADGSIPPVIALLHDPRMRHVEYGHDPRHGRHVMGELLPHVAARLAFTGVVALGSSLGAVAALGLAWDHPDRVGGLGLLSGPFARRVDEHRPADVFASVVALVGSLDDRRLAGVPTYVSAGRYEALVDLNRALVPRLRSIGVDVRYDETWEGHQWMSWRDRLGPALLHTLE